MPPNRRPSTSSDPNRRSLGRNYGRIVRVLPLILCITALLNQGRLLVDVSKTSTIPPINGAPQFMSSSRVLTDDPAILNDNSDNSVISRPCKPGKKISAALVLFGVAKSFKFIWESYYRNIIERNPHVDFEVHVHMYSDVKTVNTPKNREHNMMVDSPLLVRRILDGADIPTKFVTSSQVEFDKTLFSWLDDSDTLIDFDIHSTRNVFRQGNSMKEAFLSASAQTRLMAGEDGVERTSKDRCGHDLVYIFARLDTLLMSGIDIPRSGMGTNDIRVPAWQSWDGASYNDRFALAGPSAANSYTTAKALAFKEMVLDQKRKKGNLKMLNAELMLKRWLDGQDDINVTVVPNWAKLIRIRGRGQMEKRDANSFKLDLNGNVHDLSFVWTPLPLPTTK